MTTSTTLMAAHEDEHRKATAEKIVDALIPELARTSPSVRTEAIAQGRKNSGRAGCRFVVQGTLIKVRGQLASQELRKSKAWLHTQYPRVLECQPQCSLSGTCGTNHHR